MIKPLLLLLAAVFAFAETPAVLKTITLTTGRGELLTFPADVKGVAAAEPKIADVVVISPREVMVNAKEPGKTTVIVWDGAAPMRYDINVVPDTTEFDNFKANMSAQLPGSDIEVTGKGDTIVLKGTAKDAAQVEAGGRDCGDARQDRRQPDYGPARTRAAPDRAAREVRQRRSYFAEATGH